MAVGQNWPLLTLVPEGVDVASDVSSVFSEGTILVDFSCTVGKLLK